MKFHQDKRHQPFVTLPRHKRSNEVIQLKGKMRREAAEYGGRFTSSLVLQEEPARPDIFRQWFEFYFPGTDRFTIWNAMIMTARKAFWDEAHVRAYRRAIEMLPPEKRDKPKISWIPAERSSTGKVLSYEMVESAERFDGLSFHELWRKLEGDVVRSEPPTIHESFKLDRSYAYGIGVAIVLDVEVIDRAAIELAIDRFLAIGQTDWVSPDPVARDRLPAISEHEALETLDSGRKG